MAQVLEWMKKLKGRFGGEKGVRLVLILGLAGMALILLSEFWPGGETEKAPEGAAVQVDYAAQLEEKLTRLVTSIEGVGKAQVLVTLENGVEYVYASEEKKNTDVTHDYSGQEVTKLHEKDNSESNYILVDGSGGKEALIRTQKEPKVKGVVVVCEGAGKAEVEEQVIRAVTTALNLSSVQVCVSQMAYDTDSK